MDHEEAGPTNGSVPRLTIAQRILTSLPNLDRGRKGAVGEGRRRPDAEADDEPRSDPAGSDRSARAIEPDAVISPEGAEVDASARPSRLRDSFMKPPAAGKSARKVDPTADMTKEELAHAIKRLDDRERTYAMYAGPLGAVVGVILTIAAIHYNPALHHKGHVANSVTELYGAARVVLGAIVFACAFTRRRSLVAFALLFLGTAEGFPFALLFWGLGGWMIWRVFRFQKLLTAKGGGPQRGRPAQTPRAAARAGASEARDRARTRTAAPRERRRGKSAPEPAGPPPSKRYTPPRPTRPRPPAPS
jgi:hypothetical protein